MTSVFLANIHFRGNHGQRVPRWLHNLVLVYMAKVVGARSMIINASKYPEVCICIQLAYQNTLMYKVLLLYYLLS